MNRATNRSEAATAVATPATRYITVEDLHESMTEVGVIMGAREVEVLAMGTVKILMNSV